MNVKIQIPIHINVKRLEQSVTMP